MTSTLTISRNFIDYISHLNSFTAVTVVAVLQGFSGRDGIPGKNGQIGPPGHVFIIPVSELRTDRATGSRVHHSSK